MRRKVVQHGASTLTISLPSKWVEETGLQKGEEVEVEIQGKRLLLYVDSKRKKELHLNYTKKEFLKRDLRNAYKQGFDEVLLTFAHEIPLDIILDQLEELLGFEIIEQNQYTLKIKNVATGDAQDFESILKRLFFLTLSFSRSVLNAQNTAQLQNLKRIEKENNKLVTYCQRLLNTGVFFELPKITHYYEIVDRLEFIADALRDLCDTQFSKNEKKFHEELQIYFDKIYVQFFQQTKNHQELKKLRLQLYQTLPQQGLYRQILDQLHHIEVSL
jgi:phosphate uptake regulator